MDTDSAKERRSAAAIPLVTALLLCVLGVYPLANRLTGGEAVPWYGQVRHFWMVVGVAILVVLVVLSRFAAQPMDALWNASTRRVLAIPSRIFIGGAALIAFAATVVIAWYCFGRQPHNADEVAQLFHAKMLLHGRLFLPPDPNPEFFGMDNMIEKGRWYSQFPIGGPVFLALGMVVGAAWLVNPVMFALSVLSLYGFVRRVYDERTARAVVILFALCPFALFMSASFMNHVPVLWLTTVALMQLAVWADASDRGRVTRAAAFIGLALGGAFSIRPLDALVVAMVVGLAQLDTIRERRGGVHLRSLVVQVAAGLVPVAILFVVNARTNGAPMRLGYEVLYGSAHQLGFHMDPYGTMHTPMRALMFASKYLLQLNVLLFEWPLPVVLLIAAGLAVLRRPTRWDTLLIGLLMAQLIAYAAYWHNGNFRGPRFLFTALPAILVLTARAPVWLGSVTDGTARRLFTWLVPSCVLFSWFAFGINMGVPARIRGYRKMAPLMRVDPDRLVTSAHLHHALVFINEGQAARNLHYLWGLGLSRGNAARLMVSASPCAIRLSLDAEAARRPVSERGRLDRLVRPALALDRDTIKATPPVCVEDVQMDREGTASYAPFFPANTFDTDGHLDGNVVDALDYGNHDEALRARFGDRTWYRFGQGLAAGDTVATLRPYVAGITVAKEPSAK
ncbi:hypothetical protein BH11GEM2_BH11GEM2_27100 [soil metagenome]